MAGSSVGAKWIILLLVYFFLLTSTVTIVSFIDDDFTFSSDTIQDNGLYGNPRLLYNPYDIEPYGTTDDRKAGAESGIYTRLEGHLECSRSQGIISQQYCENIEGCVWEQPAAAWYVRAWWKLTGQTSAAEETCTGDINATFYDIDTHTPFLGFTPFVAAHNYTKNTLQQIGAMCTHPNVRNNETLALLFSCTEMQRTETTLDIESIEFGFSFISMVKKTWTNIAAFFTLSFDWGFETEYINYMLTLMFFYIPLVVLFFGVVVIIRS